MKKLLIVLSIFGLFLFFNNCSGDSSVTSSDTLEENTETSGEGGVSFTFTKGSKMKADDGLVTYKSEVNSLPDPTNVRVVVRRYEGNDLKYNTLGDVEVPTDTTMVLNVPAGEGYQIDAFSYVDSLDHYKYLLKYDQVTGQNVVADSVTNVSLTLEPINPQFTVPDSVEKGNEFMIGVDFNSFGKAPISYQYDAYITTDTSYNDTLNAFLENREYGNINSQNFSADWDLSESEFEEQYIYFKTQFVLGPNEYYKSDERDYTLKFNYPNPFFSDDTLKTYIAAPDGGIGVDVEY